MNSITTPHETELRYLTRGPQSPQLLFPRLHSITPNLQVSTFMKSKSTQFVLFNRHLPIATSIASSPAFSILLYEHGLSPMYRLPRRREFLSIGRGCPFLDILLASDPRVPSASSSLGPSTASEQWFRNWSTQRWLRRYHPPFFFSRAPRRRNSNENIYIFHLEYIEHDRCGPVSDVPLS